MMPIPMGPSTRRSCPRSILANGINLAFAWSCTICPAEAKPLSPATSAITSRDETSWYYLTDSEILATQVATSAFSAVSMIASCLAFYWFYRMKKRFRHRLIVLLVYGDLVRSTSLFLFASISAATGMLRTTSPLCQASGFFIQYGVETSDYAVLIMALHSALQVFRPSTGSRNDGLYHYRAYIYVGGFLVPILMSALAFTNPRWGYLAQGAFCTLPLRPFWYRLALTWIPRYMIATIIIGLAVGIYAHVGFEFRSFSRLGQPGKPSITSTQMLSISLLEEGDTETMHEPQLSGLSNRRASSVVHDIVAAPCTYPGTSVIGTAASPVSTRQHQPEMRSKSLPASRRPSVFLDAQSQHSQDIISPIPTHPSVATLRKYTSNQTNVGIGHEDDNPRRESHNISPLSNGANAQIQQRLILERARVHKQLRLIFIYPLVYTLMWLLPFANHCMMYQDKWAARPLFWLALLSTVCIGAMGAVDCLIFTLRERPWRHIASSDGTFRGSFLIWRRDSGSTARRLASSVRGESFVSPSTVGRPYGSSGPRFSADHSRRQSQKRGSVVSSNVPSLPSLRKALSVGSLGRGNRRGSRSDDQAKIERDYARERLEHEREDRRRSLWDKELATRRSVAEINERRGSLVVPRDFGTVAPGRESERGRGSFVHVETG